MRRISTHPKETLRCITRVNEPAKRTLGWNVRIIRRGIRITEFFSDRKYGGKAGALSEAIHFRDEKVRELKPVPRSEIARRKTPRNTSGIPGVRRRVKPLKRGGKVFDYVVWSATGSPSPGVRKTRDFYVSKLGEDDAREAAIAQRLAWEKQMERNEERILTNPRRASR
jgi:hypothetical protein